MIKIRNILFMLLSIVAIQITSASAITYENKEIYVHYDKNYSDYTIHDVTLDTKQIASAYGTYPVRVANVAILKNCIMKSVSWHITQPLNYGNGTVAMTYTGSIGYGNLVDNFGSITVIGGTLAGEPVFKATSYLSRITTPLVKKGTIIDVNNTLSSFMVDADSEASVTKDGDTTITT